jgi:hypothetical protein
MAKRGSAAYEAKTAEKSRKKKSKLERKASKGRIKAGQKLASLEALEASREEKDPAEIYAQATEAALPYQEQLAATQQDFIRQMAAQQPGGGMFGGDFNQAMDQMQQQYQDTSAKTFGQALEVEEKIAAAKSQQDFANFMSAGTAAQQMALATAQMIKPLGKSAAAGPQQAAQPIV